MGLDRTNILLLDAKIRAAGIPIHGLNSNRQIHFNTATPEQETAAQAIADAYGLLGVTADAPSIAADGIAVATISCNDALIASDALLSYTVYGSGGAIEFQGTIDVTAGAASYPFTTRIKDKYTVELARVSGLETGTIQVEAV